MFLVIVLIGKELPLPCTAQLAFADISNFSRDLWPFFPPAAFNSLSFALFPSQKQLRTASLGDFKHNSQATYHLVGFGLAFSRSFEEKTKQKSSANLQVMLTFTFKSTVNESFKV